MTDLCTICGFDTEKDNLIVYCSSCNMGVHQTCYGISEVGCKTDSRRIVVNSLWASSVNSSVVRSVRSKVEYVLAC